MTELTQKPTIWNALWDEPLALIIDQPHQLFISTMSIGLMAGFASSHDIIHPWLGLVVAVGIEWAWLRGITSNRKEPSAWGSALNYSAFGIAALWGTLWVAESFQAYDPKAYGWVMAVIHVVPLVWLSLCSAMAHQTMTQAETKRERTKEAQAEQEAKVLRDQQNALQLERERKLLEVEAWKDIQLFKSQLPASAQNAPAPHTSKEYAQPKLHQCASCGASLTVKQYAASQRWGHCAKCKGK